MRRGVVVKRVGVPVLLLAGGFISCAFAAADAPQRAPGLFGRALELPPDPEEDGWTSEAFYARSSAVLHSLEEWMAGDAPATALRPLLAPGARATPLRPPLQDVLEDAPWGVQRAAPDPQPRLGLSAEQALTQWRSQAGERESPRVTFKVFGLEETAGGVRAIAHHSHVYRRGGLAVEENALWEIGWKTGTKPPPQVTSLTLRSLERVEHRSAAAPLADLTRAVAGAPGLWEQLARGVPHWQRTLEDFYHVYPLGLTGLAVADADGDGRDDVYLCQGGGLPNRLLLQQADGTVRDEAAARGADYLDQTQAALFVDVDNDGDQDLWLATSYALLLLENDGGGRFSLRLQMPEVRDAYSLAAADYDRDGRLDLFTCGYYPAGGDSSELATPSPYFDANNGGANHLLRQEPDGRFIDVTEACGLGENNRRFSYAAVWEDFDANGEIDLYVANDFGRNNLFEQHDGRFVDVASRRGLDAGAFGMSAAAGDYDQDGDFDIHLGAMFSGAGGRITRQQAFKRGAAPTVLERFQLLARGNFLFRNDGGRFADVSLEAGITLGRWAWSSVFADLNNDGREDLLVANGFVTNPEPEDL